MFDKNAKNNRLDKALEEAKEKLSDSSFQSISNIINSYAILDANLCDIQKTHSKAFPGNGEDWFITYWLTKEDWDNIRKLKQLSIYGVCNKRKK